ncbi:MAG: hypothetical protein C5B51_18225 [Terriglobia bacterium]|nr:MAG: hypothetical protein C5B51_18225 [Terriglobia bacterium]
MQPSYGAEYRTSNPAPLHPDPLVDTIKLMTRVLWLGLWIAGLSLLAVPAPAQTLVERGKYLVERVAHCGDCHTPPDSKGKPDTTRLLKGVKTQYMTTPDITSAGPLWLSWKDEGILRFLETHNTPSGGTSKHPMPPYKLRPDDAGAIVAYLKTLK